MNKFVYLSAVLAILISACSSDDDAITINNTIPVVKTISTYTVLTQEDVTYAEGLGHSAISTTAFSVPLKLDVYTPDNNLENRPLFMFIHGGGFTGGTKTKPEIVDMANYYASRGWVFVSVDYRTTEELGVLDGMTPAQVLTYYKGIAPQEWMEHIFEGAESPSQVKQATAMYMAQRDCKAALRWLVANANNYHINTDYITVGGASAGAITTIALGISNLEDFRDEISITDDPTLLTTNLNQTYSVKSMVYFWGSNSKLDLYENVYDLDQYNRYDTNDPELFMAHGEATDPQTPYSEALELQDIYSSLGVYSKLETIMVPSTENPTELVDAGHGAWNGQVDGKGIFELSFEFLVERQNLSVE